MSASATFSISAALSSTLALPLYFRSLILFFVKADPAAAARLIMMEGPVYDISAISRVLLKIVPHIFALEPAIETGGF